MEPPRPPRALGEIERWRPRSFVREMVFFRCRPARVVFMNPPKPVVVSPSCKVALGLEAVLIIASFQASLSR